MNEYGECEICGHALVDIVRYSDDADEVCPRCMELALREARTEIETLKNKVNHYEEGHHLICSLAVNYDGFRNAKGLVSLIDDMVDVSVLALRGREFYVNRDGVPVGTCFEDAREQ